MRALRRRFWQRAMTRLVDVTIALADRGAEPTAADIRRHLWCENTRRMGLRFVEAIRDAWRARWLRIRRPEG